jgi:hypothetical protein
MDFLWVLGVGGGELVQKDLQAIAVRGGQFQHKALAAVGRHGPAKPEVLKALLEGADRFDARQGEPPTLDGVEAKAAFILHPQANALTGMGCLHGLKWFLQARVAKSDELRLFFCPWLLRATFKVAPS